MDVADGRV